MLRAFILLCLGFGLSLAACGKDAGLPNLVTKVVDYGDGTRGLNGWQAAPSGNERQVIRHVPIDAAFAGAATYFIQVETADPKAAAREAVEAEGLSKVKIRSLTKIDPEYIRALDPDPAATGHTFWLEGTMNGKAARAVGYVWYGSFGHESGVPSNSGVHVFAAPTPAFKALGGMAIPGVLWLGGGTAEDEDMREDGNLSPDAATRKLASFFQDWAQAYLQQQMNMTMMMGQTMAIQQQTLDQMQSYNNAMSACGGAGDCMVMNGDGTWSADVQ